MNETDVKSLYSHYIKEIKDHTNKFVPDKYNGPFEMRFNALHNYFVLELYFDNNNKRLALIDRAEILNYENKDENHKVIYLSAVFDEEIRNAIYEFIEKCTSNNIKYLEFIKFDSKEQLFEYFDGLPSDARCATYYREFCNTIVEVRKIDFNCSQVQKNLNSTRTTNNIVPIATPTSFAPKFDQEIYNKSISATISPLIDTTNTNLSVPRLNTTDYNDNIPKLTTSADSDNSYLAFVVLFLIAAFLVFFICCRSRFQRRNSDISVIRTVEQLEALGREEIDEHQSISAGSEEDDEQSASIMEESECSSTSTEGEQPSELEEVKVEGGQRSSRHTSSVVTRALNCLSTNC